MVNEFGNALLRSENQRQNHCAYNCSNRQQHKYNAQEPVKLYQGVSDSHQGPDWNHDHKGQNNGQNHSHCKNWSKCNHQGCNYQGVFQFLNIEIKHLLLFLAFIMRVVPLLETHKTELKLTNAIHVIAAFVLIDKHATVGTAPPFFMGLFQHQVAIALMLLVHALCTKIFATGVALRWDQFHIDLAFTLLLRTEFKVWIGDGLTPELDSFVFVFERFGEFCVNLSFQIDFLVTTFVRTSDFLHGVDFETDILNQTVFAIFMVTVAQVEHFSFMVGGFAELTVLSFQFERILNPYIQLLRVKQQGKPERLRAMVFSKR